MQHLPKPEYAPDYVTYDSGNIGPADAAQSPRFAGIATFARLPRLEEVSKADIAVVGVPFDAGDIPVNPFNIEEAVAQIEAGADYLRKQGMRLVTIGGDHTLALPMLRSVAKEHGPVAVVHFDAHLDTWDTYFGAPVTHGTPFRRASEEGLIDMEASLHVGTRGPLYGAEDLRDDERLGFAIISSVEIENEGVAAAIARMRKRLGDRPVYISVDIDVLDPAHAPGTGTPEAGGMTSRELLRMLRAFSDLNVVGADVVEVSPPYDHAQMTAVAASHVAYEFICAMAANPPQK